MPPHLELRFQLQASSPQALTRGDFGLTRFVGLDSVTASELLADLSSRSGDLP